MRTDTDEFLSARPARGRDGSGPASKICDNVSIRAARAGPRRSVPSVLPLFNEFLSARPARGRDRSAQDAAAHGRVSIRAARAGPRRETTYSATTASKSFYPRGPRGAATENIDRQFTDRWFLSARPARGRDHSPPFARRHRPVSIRAARAGPRRGSGSPHATFHRVSIRAARAGPRPEPAAGGGSARIVSIRAARAGPRRAVLGVNIGRRSFLSARPARGRDSITISASGVTPGFYPRGPRGAATRHDLRLRQAQGCFYPRGPRGAATILTLRPLKLALRFYPRGPRGAATTRR